MKIHSLDYGAKQTNKVSFNVWFGDALMTNLPTALYILLAIATLLAILAIRGYLSTGKLAPQHRTWLLIAGILLLVTIVVPRLNG